MYPLALLGSTAFSTQTRAQLHDPVALVFFTVYLAFILDTSAFSVLGGHSAWALRRQLFEARSILQPRRRTDPVALRRFEREVRATSELSHPNTVRIFDYGMTPELEAFILENLSKDPSERCGSAGEFAARLSALYACWAQKQAT